MFRAKNVQQNKQKINKSQMNMTPETLKFPEENIAKTPWHLP